MSTFAPGITPRDRLLLHGDSGQSCGSESKVARRYRWLNIDVPLICNLNSTEREQIRSAMTHIPPLERGFNLSAHGLCNESRI